MKKILSPIQKAQLLGQYPELRGFLEQQETNNLLRELAGKKTNLEGVEKLKGEKGDKGDTPQKYIDYWTESDIKELSKMIKPKRGEDYFTNDEIREFLKAVTPVKGQDYYEGRDGQDGRDGAPGKTPIVGVDYPSKEDFVKMIEQFVAKIPWPKDGKDGSPDEPEHIARKINTLSEAIDAKAIKGMPTIKSIVDEIRQKKMIGIKDVKDMPLNMNDMRWHGGGLSKVSHDATLSGSGTASDPLRVTSSGSFTVLAATGTIDDSNTMFGFASLPTLININGGFYQQTGGAITWTWNAGTKVATLSSPVGTGGSIFGIS